MAETTSDDPTQVPGTGAAPAPAADRIAGPGDAWLCQQALGAAATAMEATAERVLAERDATTKRFYELERRLVTLEQVAPAGTVTPGQSDLDAAVAPLIERLARLETSLWTLDVPGDIPRRRADRLDKSLRELTQRVAGQLDDAALSARIDGLLSTRLATRLNEPVAPDPATNARLDALAAQVQALASAFADLEQAQDAPAAGDQALPLQLLAERLAALEALSPRGAPPETAPEPRPTADGAVPAAALAALADRLQAFDAFRDGPWAERARFLDDPCALAGWLAGDYLPPNTPLAVLRAVDAWLEAHFADAVRLILPTAGAPFDSSEHERIETVTAAGGMLRSVLKLVRPGLRCQGVVRRKAEVVAS